MADNVPITAGAGTSVATDDIGGIQHQRVKVGHGVDGSYVDASATNPLPVVDNDAAVTGTISAPDTVVGSHTGTGTLLTGTPTVNSYVAIACLGGDSAWNLQVSGTFGGTTLFFEISLNSTNGIDGNWINVNGRQTGITNTVLTYSITSAGIYRGNTSGVVYFRVRAVGGAAISIAVVIRVSAGTGAIFLNASIPAGNNNIGTVNAATPYVLFKGRASSFRIVGRAGTAGQKIMSIHNATGSAIIVTVEKIFIDLVQTAIIAATVIPPIIRMWKVTVLPTNGTSLTKNKLGGTSTSNASVTVLGDASADGTNSATALTATLPAGTIVSQEFAPRLITAAGYEIADRMEFFGDSEVVLNALEGLVVYLDYTLTTQNPATNFWIAGMEWTEN